MHRLRTPHLGPRRLPSAVALLACMAACGIGADGAVAGPTTVYASSASTATTPCTATAPCSLVHAIAAANTAGDTVVVLPGTYSITSALNTGRAITIEGQPGQPFPSLVGASTLGAATLSASGGTTIRDLSIATTSTAADHAVALSLNGGTAQNLILSASSNGSKGTALAVSPASPASIVSTVLVTSQAPNGSAVSLTAGSDHGSAALYNVTAIGQGATTSAVANSIGSGTALVKDSILSGQGGDITASSSDQSVDVSYSDFRPSAASGYVDQGGNVSVAPTFVAGATGNFREDPRSSTIDAGSPDTDLTATDLDGNPRTAGSAPDMGAYEFVAAPSGGGSTGGGSTGGGTTGGSTGGGTTGGSTGGGTTGGGTGEGRHTGQLPAPSRPVIGVSVTLRPASGKVLVKLPGAHGFVALSSGAQLPVGTVINASRGSVLLTSAVTRSGVTKTGTFSGSSFVVRQAKAARAVTTLKLTGGSFAACTAITHAPLHSATWVPRHHRVVRQLWGSDNGGSFTTIGRSASATVRGTVWLTQDRCDGTLIRVIRGHVAVHSAHHHTVVLGPGQSYFARA